MSARLQTCKADYLFGTVLPASGNNERVNAGKAVGCITAKPKQCDKKKNSERTENVTPVLPPPLFLVADAARGCRCAGIQSVGVNSVRSPACTCSGRTAGTVYGIA